MHETSLMKDLIKKIESVAAAQAVPRVCGVWVKIGVFANCTAEHFAEHFQHASVGTCAHLAKLHIAFDDDEQSPCAQDIVLESVELTNEF